MLGRGVMLPFTLFLISLPGLHLAFGASIELRLTTNDPNHLTLECFSSVTGDLIPEATIFFFSSPSVTLVGSVRSGGTVDVTPMNEGFFRCVSSDGSDRSDLVPISGKWLHGSHYISVWIRLSVVVDFCNLYM